MFSSLASEKKNPTTKEASACRPDETLGHGAWRWPELPTGPIAATRREAKVRIKV